MAQIERSSIVDYNMKYDDAENVKRRKRFRDDDEKTFLSQRKRNFVSPYHAPTSTTIRYRRPNGDDQDDDALIRETQAALKSLSGSWPDERPLNESEENPTFHDLFEEKSNYRKFVLSPMTSMPPPPPPPPNSHMIYSSNEVNGSAEVLRDGFPFREYNGKFKSINQKTHQSKCPTTRSTLYAAHDFTDLVDDSSNEQATQSEMANVVNVKNEESDGLRKMNESAYNGQMYRMMPTFAENSAFRPPTDIKRGPMPSSSSSYQQQPQQPLLPQQPPMDSMNFLNYTPTTGLNKENYSKRNGMAKDDESTNGKSGNSPDSKQYTTLQPAGVDSKAASVMQGIAREGVLSVAAVSSTSSPAVQRNTSDDRAMPSFSPTSTAKGMLHDLTQFIDFSHFAQHKCTRRTVISVNLSSSPTPTHKRCGARDFIIASYVFGVIKNFQMFSQQSRRFHAIACNLRRK